MRVGRHHNWSQRQHVYERKIAPGKWDYRYTGYKRQRPHKGIKPGSRLVWKHVGYQTAYKTKSGLYRVRYHGRKYLVRAKIK